ncbi:MAG: AAA family ATPase [Polyangiales bacterium]
MVVWINGAFGVGKTSVAKTIVARSRRTVLFDPETIGVGLSLLSRTVGADSRDLPSWRRWTVRGVTIAAKLYECVVVPMTVVNPDYFEELLGTLRRRVEVRHFTLVAPPETIRERLRQRGDAGSWAEAKVQKCTEAHAAPMFAMHVSTLDRTIQDIAEEIVWTTRSVTK